MTEPASEAIQAWRDLCSRLERLGEEVVGEGYAGADALEMLQHVADQATIWLGWSVFHADPARPTFHRHQALIGRYGGPNLDNVYRHVRLDPARRYRIAGTMHGCDDWLLTLRAGFMHEPVHGTLADLTASDLGIRRGDDFEVLLGEGGHPIPDGVRLGTIREYYLDWQAAEPATFTIECLDPPEAAPELTDAGLAERFRDAGAAVEHSVTYWYRYLEEVHQRGPANTFQASHRGAKGLNLAQYAFCPFDLGPDDALVVETDLPPARYWSLHLYPMGTFEHVDPFDRVTSLNHEQAVVGDGGRLRAVVGATDPGEPNWLDTGGRRRGLLTFRWFWPTGEGTPSPRATVVPASSLAGPVAPEARSATMAARRRHLAWRFRA